MPQQPYAESIFKTLRRPTRTVMVGNVAVGSEHPIRVQTMTTSDTKNVNATVEEVRQSNDTNPLCVSTLTRNMADNSLH